MQETDAFELTPVIGDEAWRKRERARRCTEWTIQIAVVAVVVFCLFLLAGNIANNMATRHIRSGFDFLLNSASFDIGEAMFEFRSADEMWRAFVVGMMNTIKVSLFAIVSAMILGIIVGLMRLSAHPMIRLLGAAHVEFYRNIPLIIQLFFIYLVITELLPMGTEALRLGTWAMLSKAGLQVAVPEQVILAFIAMFSTGTMTLLYVRERYRRKTTGLVSSLAGVGVSLIVCIILWTVYGAIGGWSKPIPEGFSIEGGASLSPEFLSLWLGLTLFTSASIAEIVRAGVLAVPRGQWNAGLALGMSRVQVVSYVIFPQSMRLAIPPLASQFMNLTKNSSLAVVIGYPDLVAVGNMSINVTGQAFEVICIIMAVYLVLNLIISVVMNLINASVMKAPR